MRDNAKTGIYFPRVPQFNTFLADNWKIFQKSCSKFQWNTKRLSQESLENSNRDCIF